MSVVKNYDQFINEGGDGHINFKDGLNESRSMAKWNSDDFKQMFSQKILESNGSVDSLLVEKLHSYYEVSMLLEARQNWFTDGKRAHFIDCEQGVILVKNSEAFVIEKKTFDLMKGSTSWISEVESSPLIKEGFNLINEGFLSKAKDFLVKCKNFLIEMVKPKSTEEWTMLVISILSGVAGIVGIAVPGFTIVGGILLAFNGIMHINHGVEELAHAREEVKAVKGLKPVESAIATYIKAAPAFLAGGLGLSMGVYDITTGLTTALANPLAGASSGAIGAAAKKGISIIGGPGGFVHHFIEESLHHVIGNEATLKAVEALAFGILPVVLHAVLKKFIPFIWNAILSGADKLATGIEFISNLPAKVSDMISKYQEFAKDKSWFNLHTIISKGLGMIVKPITDKLSQMVEKYFKPGIVKIKEFIANQQEAAKILEQHDILQKDIEASEKAKPLGVQPITEDQLKPVIAEAPTEVSSGKASEDKPENQEDVEAAKSIVKDLEQKTGKPSEEGEKPEGEKNESKKWRYLTEFNKFNH